MTERRAFPSPPIKTAIAEANRETTLAWSQWFGAVALWVQRVRVFIASVDWPSIPAGGTTTATVAAEGVRPGDFCIASNDPTHADLVLSAQVTANDTITVRAVNHGAGAVDLAAGTLRVRVEKAR